VVTLVCSGPVGAGWRCSGLSSSFTTPGPRALRGVGVLSAAGGWVGSPCSVNHPSGGSPELREKRFMFAALGR
jgi:hypothetical protein